METYAIVQTGGKQYKVEKGDVISVESIPEPDGGQIELRDVRLVSRNGEVFLGSPTVKGAKVTAEVLEHVKGKKVVVFKYKPKIRYRRRTGHRQQYTDLKVTRISYRRTKEKETDGS